jgi:deoxyribonuclease IV
MSIEGGLHLAIRRGEALGCTAIQIFTKNASQWRAPPLSDHMIDDFRREQERTAIVVIAHDAYLINLGSPKRGLLEKSRSAFLEEMNRAEKLGIPYLVMHPGSHTGSGEEAGLTTLVQSFDLLLKDTLGYAVQILVENTAGQGTALGHSFPQLKRLVEDVVCPERMGVCFDTCHAFAAGYDLQNETGYERVLGEFDEIIGLDRLKALHLNDSKKGLGSGVDRHEHIGLGMLGLETFRLIMNDPRLRDLPKVLETPKYLGGTDMDSVNLELLRGFVHG